MYTKLEQLPERFTFGPHTKLMSKYIDSRWKRASYGWYRRDKSITFNPEWKPEGSSRDAYRYVEHPSDGLRFVGKVDEIRGSGDGNLPYFDRALIDHRGWFTDPYRESFKDGTGLCWGEVYQLPARNGESVYVPAYQMGGCDGGPTLDFHSTTSDLKDAIRWADSMAQHAAEAEMEYQEKDRCEQRISEIEEELAKEREELSELIREVRSNCERLTGLTTVRRVIRQAITAYRAHRDELVAEKEKIEQEGFTAIWSGY